jgi:hypothetical protein
MKEPYPSAEDSTRHAPSHFCKAIGGRVSCPKDKCKFCDEVDG